MADTIVIAEPNTGPSTTTPTVADKGEAKFTQADLDRIAGDRGMAASAAARTKLFEKFGVKDEGELEGKLKQLSDLETSRLTENERLQKEAADAKQEREAAIAKAREAKATQRLIDAALTAEMGTRFLPEARADILLYVHNTKELGDLLKVNDEDTVEGVKQVLDKVAESKKYLLAPTGNQQRTPLGTPGATGRSPALPPDGDAARQAFAQEVRRW